MKDLRKVLPIENHDAGDHFIGFDVPSPKERERATKIIQQVNVNSVLAMYISELNFAGLTGAQAFLRLISILLNTSMIVAMPNMTANISESFLFRQDHQIFLLWI